MEYIVLSRQDCIARTGAPYVNMKIANLNGNEQLCVWDVAKNDPPKVGQLVNFMSIKDDQGKKSARKMDMVAGTMPTEAHPLYPLIPRPIKREVWDATFDKLLSYCTDSKLIDIIKKYSDELFPKYALYPAATSVHHAFPGGLLNHTHQMLHMLEGLFPCYPYPDDIKIERIIIGILFHDWGKLCEYTQDGEPTENMYLLGHIYMSANYLNGILREAGIEKREINFIIHCVLAHHGEMEYGSPVLPCIPEAQIITYLDNISA
ncbi:MAG: HD domain-containing protein, partial [Bacteroidaceae bacterium]|nr:HD domain-containing protein [Bacteroidaceae bacterium]